MIDKNEFLEKIRQQFIEPDEITVSENTNFRDIDDWDSLTGMAIQVMIKDDYNVDLSVENFKLLKTVGEIYEFVNKNIQ